MSRWLRKILPLHCLLVLSVSVPLGGRDTCKSRDPVFQNKPKDASFLRVDLWLNQCQANLQSLRTNPDFPVKPTRSAVVHSLLLRPGGAFYCFRMAGFLKAPVSGYYRFTAAGGLEAEVWLKSGSDDHENSERILEIADSRQTSFRVQMQENRKVYFEVLGCAREQDDFRILWLVPGEKDYTQIPLSALQPISKQPYSTPSIQFQLPSLPSFSSLRPAVRVLDKPTQLRSCSKEIIPPTSVSEISFGQVHPFDYTDLRNVKSIVLGNQIISEQVYKNIESQIIRAFPEVSTISELRLYPEGQLWLEAKTSRGTNVGTWLGYHDNVICSTEWVPSEEKSVTMIVSVKGRRLLPQIRNLLFNLQEIRRYATEFSVDLIIVDFNDDEISKLVQQMRVERVDVVRVKGSQFDRGLAMSIGALHASPQSLLLLIDLHLQMPRDIVHRVWSHTVRGKSSYAPSLVRLNPNASPVHPNGFWDVAGFGILGVHRSDFMEAGCSDRTPTYRWGGEDHEIVNKLLKNNISVLRSRLPGLYHFHHSRDVFDL